ncbi:hypothetical protein D1BOALGB6SA_6267 [Olavius sp. associated proteobacterium Delta 1]|nr:hypothetical protein D1BOALGB6SA_6267 [Olavius sp. associated proteobacterium Delta 1]
MNIMILKDIPPWEWPRNADKMILDVLHDDSADGSERHLAVELAGDSTVICDELADALLSALGNELEPDDLRGQAAIALGPALEYAFIDDFEDPDEVPITEQMFHRIQETLYRLYLDETAPKIVRRRILEASVRAPQDWHQNAVQDAYTRDDEAWKLTAVFCMQFIRGFDEQILESLSSEDPAILYEAVCGAGNWEIKAAWPHIAAFVTDSETEKDLLLAAIESAALIRPHEASEILGPLLDSDDEDISDAVYEALAMTGAFWDEDDDEEPPTFH